VLCHFPFYLTKSVRSPFASNPVQACLGSREAANSASCANRFLQISERSVRERERGGDRDHGVRYARSFDPIDSRALWTLSSSRRSRSLVPLQQLRDLDGSNCRGCGTARRDQRPIVVRARNEHFCAERLAEDAYRSRNSGYAEI